MELDPTQILVIAFIAMLLTQAIKLLNLQLSQRVITIVVFVISVVLAVIWNPVEVPDITDPAALATWLIETAGVLVGWATLIYNVLLRDVLGRLTVAVKRALNL